MKGAGLQQVELAPGSLHPVAIEAAAEAAKLSEPSMWGAARRSGQRAG